MIFSALAIDGAWSVELAPQVDARGYFARTWCRDEFAKHGIAISIEQASVSFNRLAGTLRGMHFAWPPSAEGKLVSCGRGKAHDVLLDLRPASRSYLCSVAVQLDAEHHNAVYIPPGVAHGFQTLVEAAEITYMMSESYRAELAAGVRFDDPAFGLAWPLPVSCIAERDRNWPAFEDERHRECMREVAR